jgi:plastocyanin
MHFNTAVAAALLSAGSAVAQSTTAAGAVPSGSVMVQTVKVGGDNGELTFTPSDIQAAPGSMVQFQFWPQNHSVAQSSFSEPCQPISETNTSVPSTLWSGFMPTQSGASMMPTWTIMINDTTPIWLYCAQGNHCQSGMVAAINAVNSTGKTVDAFAQAAANASSNVAPSGGAVAATNTTGSGAPASGSAAPVASDGSTPSSGSPQSTDGAPPAATTAATGGAGSVSFSMSSLGLAGLISALVYAL